MKRLKSNIIFNRCFFTFFFAILAIMCLAYIVFSAYTYPIYIKFFASGFVIFSILFIIMLFTLGG